MIENDWLILESILYAMKYRPEYPEELDEKEIKLEKVRVGSLNAVMPILGMAKTFASRLPEEFILQNLDEGWLMHRANERFPILAERVKAHGEKREKMA